jgi:hypothetical protein
MYKVLCTGNPAHRGIAMSVKEWFPDADFVSRTNGFDLSTIDGLNKLKCILPKYNLIINSSYIMPGIQRKILDLINEVDVVGHVFSIGSVAEFKTVRHYSPEYGLEKEQLRDRSIELMSPTFKTTHITVSGFQDQHTTSDFKMCASEIVKSIQWVLDSTYAVPYISVVDLATAPKEMMKI